MRDRIPIHLDMIPYGFDIIFGAEKFNMRFEYNKTADLFVLQLRKSGKLLCYEPIIYGVQLFKDIYQSGTFPMMRIVPLDESGEQVAVTKDNFGETVLLTIDNRGGEAQ